MNLQNKGLTAEGFAGYTAGLDLDFSKSVGGQGLRNNRVAGVTLRSPVLTPTWDRLCTSKMVAVCTVGFEAGPIHERVSCAEVVDGSSVGSSPTFTAC